VTEPREPEVEEERRAAEEYVYVDDRVSRLWVLLIVAVFAAIFLYGVLFGRAGMLSPTPSPQPTEPPTPSLSPSPSLSPTPAASPSVVPSPTVEASPTVAPSPTPVAGST
jgi:hypothetical protein